MQCVVCGGTSFSIRMCDLKESREQQIKYSKYGECCSLSCAFKQSQRLVAHNGYTVKKYRVSPNSTYLVQIPNTTSTEKGKANNESKIQTQEIAEAV